MAWGLIGGYQSQSGEDGGREHPEKERWFVQNLSGSRARGWFWNDVWLSMDGGKRICGECER